MNRSGAAVAARLLEEWASWCALACIAAGPFVENASDRGIDDGHETGVPSDGICDLIETWFQGDLRAAMHDRMDKQRPSGEWSYWWPPTRLGWKSRVAFCWRMAADCERELNQATEE